MRKRKIQFVCFVIRFEKPNRSDVIIFSSRVGVYFHPKPAQPAQKAATVMAAATAATEARVVEAPPIIMSIISFHMSMSMSS